MTIMQFTKATRKKVKLIISILGPSGSGKTYSSLLLAKGIGGKVAVIDTENRRAEYYANEFEYDVLQLNPPFSPERYIDAIDAAQNAGYDVLIIDSTSHEWMGIGGCLDIHKKMPGNSYTNWAKITPKHNAFIDKIVRCDMHVIATIRGKDQYVLEEKNGKQAPKKVGVGGEQRDGFEYECTVSFTLDQENHIATTTKDNTKLFEQRYEVLTEEDGKRLLEWANTGTNPITKAQIEDIKKLQKESDISKEELKMICVQNIKKEKFLELTEKDASKLISILKKYKTESVVNE